MTKQQRALAALALLAALIVSIVLLSQSQSSSRTENKERSSETISETVPSATPQVKGKPDPVMAEPFAEAVPDYAIEAIDATSKQRVSATLLAHTPRIRSLGKEDIEFEADARSDGIIHLAQNRWEPERLGYSIHAEAYVPKELKTLSK
jgi:hypothetical protein